jgi:hypothetical protein
MSRCSTATGGLRNLGVGDFEVRDNQVRQTLQAVDANTLPIDLRLVFDTSGSISERAISRGTCQTMTAWPPHSSARPVRDHHVQQRIADRRSLQHPPSRLPCSGAARTVPRSSTPWLWRWSPFRRPNAVKSPSFQRRDGQHQLFDEKDDAGRERGGRSGRVHDPAGDPKNGRRFRWRDCKALSLLTRRPPRALRTNPRSRRPSSMPSRNFVWACAALRAD